VALTKPVQAEIEKAVESAGIGGKVEVVCVREVLEGV